MCPQDPGRWKVNPGTEVDLKVLQRPSIPKKLKKVSTTQKLERHPKPYPEGEIDRLSEEMPHP